MQKAGRVTRRCGTDRSDTGVAGIVKGFTVLLPFFTSGAFELLVCAHQGGSRTSTGECSWMLLNPY